METNRIPIKKLALGVGAVLAISIVIMLTIGIAVTDNTSAQDNLRDGNICLVGMSNTDFMQSADQASFEEAVDRAPFENAVDRAPIVDAVDRAPFEDAVDQAPLIDVTNQALIENNVKRESTIHIEFIWMSCIFLVGYCYWRLRIQ